MKQLFAPDQLPGNSLFLACSSHEERCLGIVRRWAGWRPARAVIFHYDDPNPRREANHAELLSVMNSGAVEVAFTERNAVASLHRHRDQLRELIRDFGDRSVAVDISVFTKRHLLMLLRWLDDFGCWPRLWVVYSEPGDYEVSASMPLSFGVSAIQQLPGFSATPDPSRPLHLTMFLGYEGDRAFATYELLQPRKTTLIVPYPAYRPEWEGRTECLNRNLVSVVGTDAIVRADSLDPESSTTVLRQVFGPTNARADMSRVICPLGTKPQILGAYSYLREAIDPPAVIYTSSLRHNHNFYSHGIGNSWLIHRPR